MSADTQYPWWFRNGSISHPIDRITALIALEYPNVYVQMDAFSRVIYNDWDLHFCEEIIVQMAMRTTDMNFQNSISTAIGMLARTHGELDRETIYPLLEYLLQYPEYEHAVRDALNEIETYLFGRNISADTRGTAWLLARAVAEEPRAYYWELPPSPPRRRKAVKIRPQRRRRR